MTGRGRGLNVSVMVDPQQPLALDLYELTMAQAYLAERMHTEPATFSLFVRHLPEGWGFLVAAGLEQALERLERLSFAEEDLAYLETTRLFSSVFLDHLRGVHFRGDVRGLPEGTPFFPHEPVIEVDATLLEAQLVETAVLNAIHVATVIASKAARCVAAAAGRPLVDFGMRRAHGLEAALAAARSAWIAGFAGTSNVLAGKLYGIPVSGTMAHSLVEAFDDEERAFTAFASAGTGPATLLVDTYDTVEGTRRAARVAAALGDRVRGVRIDSGDLAVAALEARRVLDDAGLAEATIVASGGLDEHEIARLAASGAPIDGFGVGSSFATGGDAPYLDMAYKLVAAAGRPVLKLSRGKATWPGRKQVYRTLDGGLAVGDLIALADHDPHDGVALIEPMMSAGVRIGAPTLADARARFQARYRELPRRVRQLAAGTFPVDFSRALRAERDIARAAITVRQVQGART